MEGGSFLKKQEFGIGRKAKHLLQSPFMNPLVFLDFVALVPALLIFFF